MSLHKLTAGAGYDYLTRQVTALDSTEKGHTGLASYYTERGETPGVWIGSGMNGIDGLTAGDPVTAEQMRALFACGLHPLAELRQQQLEGPELTTRDFQEVTQLGVPFKIFDGDVSPFRLEVAKRIGAINTVAGLPVGASLPAADRARVRTEVAREFFGAEHGREPVNARELAGQIAKESRPRTQTVAGYDLTFSPVKSVSALWAIADPPVAAVIERAHQAAVKDALAFIERHALFTRTGPQGIRQVNVQGLVAVAFTHRDSRAGDPDLHTHVAVANKVQTLDGRWLSIDGRLLFKANVAASEAYNTTLEQHLRDTLGVRFAERPGSDPGKRPIREIIGVDPRLNQRWSTRRAHINTRRGDLAIQFQKDHGRPPTPVEALHLAQQATLETRDAKHEPRSLAEQRVTWLSEAAAVLGGRAAVAAMVQMALTPAPETATIADARWVAKTADHVLAVMEEFRSTWQMWHVRAEVQRQVRTADVPIERASVLVDLLVDEVLDRRSVALVPSREGIDEPQALRRTDGSSVYTVAGSDLYTSQRILDAEQRLVATAGRGDGTAVDESAVDLALLEMAANRTVLDAGQGDLRTAGDMAAVLDWRLPARTPTNPGPLPWLPGIPSTSRADPVWGAYLDKRSQLVAELADQVQDHVCQSDGPPAWASPGSHLSTALVREIAVWRAANGINPQDPRPTGGTQLETLPARWKQRLDRDIAHATCPPADARADERQAAHTAVRRWHDDRQRLYQKPNGARAGRPRPAGSRTGSTRRASSLRWATPRRNVIRSSTLDHPSPGQSR